MPCRAGLQLPRWHPPPPTHPVFHPSTHPLPAQPHYEYTSSILSDLDPAQPISLDGLRLLASRESVTEPPQVGGGQGWVGGGMPDRPAWLAGITCGRPPSASLTPELLVSPNRLFSPTPTRHPPPQFYIKTFTDGGAAHSERCISRFPHPYPSLRDLQARGQGGRAGVAGCGCWVERKATAVCAAQCYRDVSPLQLGLPCLLTRTRLPHPTPPHPTPAHPTPNQTNPTPRGTVPQKEIIKYKRSDGLELNGTLYLPPGARAGAPAAWLAGWAAGWALDLFAAWHS